MASTLSFRDLAGRYAPTFAAYASPEKYDHGRRLWCAEIGHRVAAEITAGDLEPLLIRRRLSGLAPKTLSQDLGYVRRVFEWAIRDRLLEYNPAAVLQIKIPPNENTRWLTDEEEDLLRCSIRSRLWPRVEFALLTGLRASEQWKMQRHHIDWDKRQLLVANQKGGGSRTIPLSARALEILRDQLAQHRSEWVWPSGSRCRKSGRPHYSRSAGAHLLAAACRRAKIPHCNWHALRHTFATRLVRQGEDIRTIAALLGHRSIQMTMRYLKIDDAASRTAMEKLATRRMGGYSRSAPKEQCMDLNFFSTECVETSRCLKVVENQDEGITLTVGSGEDARQVTLTPVEWERLRGWRPGQCPECRSDLSEYGHKMSCSQTKNRSNL